MAEIVLSTLNAKYIHAAFGLRYLYANMGELEPQTSLLEFDIHQRPSDVVEALLAQNPRIVGLGIYIWNAAPSREVVSLLKRVAPEVLVVLGGPEVSYETEQQEICRLADYVITGEADLAFPALCQQLLKGERPSQQILLAPLPELTQIALPYRFYRAEDLSNRIVYLEASRGCPFTCEFCLSSLDIPVRQFPLDRFLEEVQQLIDRGLRHFKFVDRTFNLNLNVSRAILLFFLERHEPGRFYHFEMIPDRLPEGLRELLARFPAGSIQLEVGVQTFDAATSQRISRRQNLQALSDNFQFLRQHTGVHIHADLIVGLPGESIESFGQGFDRLIALQPQEIQVGILKRLRGTPIVRHDLEWGMVYHESPPYEIQRTHQIRFQDMQRMRRFARYWDLVGNSGHFATSLPLLWEQSSSPFHVFLRFSDWLFGVLKRTDQIALVKLAEGLFDFLRLETSCPADRAAQAMATDYCERGGRELPPFLDPYRSSLSPLTGRPMTKTAATLRRQSRHLLPDPTSMGNAPS